MSEESLLLALCSLLLHIDTERETETPFSLSVSSTFPIFFTIATILSQFSIIKRRKKQTEQTQTQTPSISISLSSFRTLSLPSPARDAQFRSQYSLSFPLFTTVAQKLKHFIEQSNLSLPPDYAISIVLSRLALGLSPKTLSERYSLEPYLISKITNMVTRLIATKLYPEFIQIPVSRKRVVENTIGFEEITDLPNVCGAVAGAAVRLRSGGGDEGLRHRQLGYPALLLQVVADHKKIFWDVCVKAPGGSDNANHLRDSLLYHRLTSGDIIWDKVVNVRGQHVRPYIIGGSDYPLLSFLLTPFGRPELRKIKSSEISNADGNEFVLHKADEKLRRTDKLTRLKNPVHDKEEALNRDLSFEHFSKPATSSSSKVSNSLKSRSHFLEVKGSPVGSVSSSPIRNLNLEQLSPSRRGKLRKNARKNDHILMVDSSKKSLNVKSNTEIIQSRTVRKVKVSGVSHSESPGFPSLDFRDNNKGQSLGGKSRVTDESSDKYRSVHLVKKESGKLETLCPGDLQLLDRYHSDDKLDKNIINESALFQEKSRKGSSLPSKGKDGSSGSNPERIKKVSVRPSEMLANPKQNLRDGIKTGYNDLKCRIKLVKDDKLTGKTLQQDQIQGINDGVAIKSDVTRKEPKRDSSSQVVSDHVAKNNQPAQIPPSTSGSHKGDAFDVVPADSACCGDSSKVLKQFNNSLDNASSQSNAAFERAEELKVYGDRLRDSGFPAEGNHSHLQAVLYFLHAASLRESCVYDSNKHGEMSPMQIYSSTAKLCELCATEYEKRNDLATAALAYKCEELAYLRVVYCKNSTMNRDRHDLQASLQIVPQGESPSSSASDVDSLNNQLIVDKAALSKSVGPHAGNHIIVARNRPSFVRLLDFMKDVNYAMEASNKSQNTFSAASHQVAQNDAAIVAVKRVIDLSFQDVDELIRLVRTALDLITRQVFSGEKDFK